jgi:hypothetical protein
MNNVFPRDTITILVLLQATPNDVNFTCTGQIL